MSIRELENLVGIGQLKHEPYAEAEYRGLIASAKKRLADARRQDLSPESRFDLAYNASHGFALAALRHHGYRPEKKRFVVFQALIHTVKMGADKMRVLSKAHDNRNLAEYEGQSEVDTVLLANLIEIAAQLETAIDALPAKAGR